MSKAEISMCWKLLETIIKKIANICILIYEETKTKMFSQLVIRNISQGSQDSILRFLEFSMHGKGGWEGTKSQGVAWSSVAFGKSEITSLIDLSIVVDWGNWT